MASTRQESSAGYNLSVVIAAYNEAQIIENNLRHFLNHLENLSGLRGFEIIVVNDGSRDGTGPIIDRLAQEEARIKAFHHKANYGQGKAFRTGFRHVTGDLIATWDADISYSPKHLDLMIDKIEETGADIISASAFKEKGSIRNVPAYRRFLSSWSNRFLAFTSQAHLSVMTCAVRLYTREVIETLDLTSDGPEINLEIVLKAQTLGFKIAEVPAELVWETRESGLHGSHRMSKMPIGRSIWKYLFIGFLLKPGIIFVYPGVLLMMVGLYMGINLLVRFHEFFSQNLHTLSFLENISMSLRSTFEAFTYTFFVSGFLILFGFQLLSLGFISHQTKRYFEELYHIAAELKRITKSAQE